MYSAFTTHRYDRSVDLYQDMAEGPACVDDTARGATALMEDYLRNGTESSFQRARDALTYISYLMARDGRMYNFTFLDAPTLAAAMVARERQAHGGGGGSSVDA